MNTLEIIRPRWARGARFAALHPDGTAYGAQQAVESARDLEAGIAVDGVIWAVTPAGNTLVIRANSIEVCQVVDDDGETVLRIVSRSGVHPSEPSDGEVPRLQSVPDESTEETPQSPRSASSGGE